ncbi:MAG: hypothetical protein ABI661_12265 [Gammaproteobacteria bacterium]
MRWRFSQIPLAWRRGEAEGPNAPTCPYRRDTALEVPIKSALEQDLRVESEVARWFPLYDAPGS